jgi:NADP-dependent aldehyde dehydrogenase
MTSARRASAAEIAAAPARDLLSPWIRDAYVKRLHQVKRVKGVRVLARGHIAKGPRVGVAHLLYVKRYARFPQTLLEEIFGPCTLVCELDAWDDVNIPRPTALTWSIYQEPRERVTFGTRFEPGIAQRFAGRVVFNGPPTGVRVAHASNHSGPWPACNRPDSTAVGPRAMERWCRHVCWQNCPDQLLPPELQDANPLRIERLVNGVRTRAPLKR